MTTVEYASWIESVMQKASRFSVLFLQLGAAHEPARRELGEPPTDVIPLEEYLSNSGFESSGVLVIDRVETIVDSGNESPFGRLRERVFADVDAGLRVILLSRAPRAAFPAVPGSSLLDDATFVQGPLGDVDRFEQMPSCTVDGLDSSAVLRSALLELGPQVCASLDRGIYESLLVGSEALSILDARELEALDGAGITSVRDGGRQWNFPRHLVHLKRALDDVVADQLDPQSQLSEVAAGLWKIERLIRRAVRQRAVEAWGDKWRQQCLNGDLSAKVLERATESAYLGASSLTQVRDPLEWLSLAELLGLTARQQIGDLGLRPALWKQFSAKVMPIRNRLAHMRMLRPDDSTEITVWLRVLESKLNS